MRARPRSTSGFVAASSDSSKGNDNTNWPNRHRRQTRSPTRCAACAAISGVPRSSGTGHDSYKRMAQASRAGTAGIGGGRSRERSRRSEDTREARPRRTEEAARRTTREGMAKEFRAVPLLHKPVEHRRVRLARQVRRREAGHLRAIALAVPSTSPRILSPFPSPRWHRPDLAGQGQTLRASAALPLKCSYRRLAFMMRRPLRPVDARVLRTIARCGEVEDGGDHRGSAKAARAPQRDGARQQALVTASSGLTANISAPELSR
jgi:hypothetical protein